MAGHDPKFCVLCLSGEHAPRWKDVPAAPHDCAEMGHLYDDDWPWPDQADMRPLAPGSRGGDPCIWCDHEKGADE